MVLIREQDRPQETVAVADIAVVVEPEAHVDRQPGAELPVVLNIVTLTDGHRTSDGDSFGRLRRGRNTQQERGMVETCLVAAPSCAAAAQVRSTVVHGQPIDLGAHLEIVRPLDDRQMVTELLVVGIVELPAIVDVVKAQVGIAVLVGVELASRTGHDVERSDTETGHAEAIVTGTGTSATPGKLLKAKPELVDHVLVETCGSTVWRRCRCSPPGRW